jgi:hypothetical protein
MASFNKFNAFVEALAQKKINLNADSLKIMLTNTAPVATNSVKTDLTDISAGNGYTAGGTAIGSNAATQSSGTLKLTGNAVTFTASGGTIGAFRYAALYDDTATNKDLIGWWDYGSSITLNDGESFKVAKDTSGNNWDSTTPILSLA